MLEMVCFLAVTQDMPQCLNHLVRMINSSSAIEKWSHGQECQLKARKRRSGVIARIQTSSSGPTVDSNLRTRPCHVIVIAACLLSDTWLAEMLPS